MLKILLLFGLMMSLNISCESGGRASGYNETSPYTEKVPETEAPQEKMQVSNVKEELAKRLEKSDPDAAAVIRSPQARINRLDTPFFRNGAVYKVEKFAPTRPIMLFIGADNGDFAVVLNANEQGYFNLAAKAGLVLDNREMCAAYVRTFLITTRSGGGKRFQLLQSVNEVKQRPKLNEAQQAEFADFQKRFADEVKPPNCTNAIPAACSVFAIAEQDLVKVEMSVSPDGKIASDDKVLQKNLLIPYAN